MAEINPLAALQGFDYTRNLLQEADQQRARRQAGAAIQSGNLGEAAGILGGQGMLDDQLALQTADRSRQTGEREQVIGFLQNATDALLGAPEADRAAVYQQIRPLLANIYDDEMLAQLDRTPLTDANLRSFNVALGGEGQGNLDPYEGAPSGFRWIRNPDGSRGLEAIPGGPATYPRVVDGVAYYPPGWNGGQIPGGQPAQQSFDTLPQGWTVQRPSQPSGGQPQSAPRPGSERSQTPTVSFGNSNEARNFITGRVPGVRLTSGPRSRADNTRVGGAENSYHLQARAWDVVPGQSGLSMAQLADRMREAGFRVLNEGDHVHVSW